jgi:hypothetical protein
MKINILIIYRVLGKKHLCVSIGDSVRGKTSRSILDIYISRGDLARVLADEFPAAIVRGWDIAMTIGS